MDPTTREILQRLRRLEVLNRVLIVALFVVLAAGVFVPPPSSGVLTLQRLNIVNHRGELVAEFSGDGRWPELVIGRVSGKLDQAGGQ